MVRLNIGCGRDVKEGWLNVDCLALAPDVCVWNLTNRWPVGDGEVEEIMASHVIEHFDSGQRSWVMNEAHRALRPGGKMTVIVPSWASGRAYGDPTHQWPPVSEMWFYYLSREWREANAPHVNSMLSCDFTATWGYATHQALAGRNPEYVQHAVNWWKEAAQDIHATLTKRA